MDFKDIINRIKSLTGYTQKVIASELFGISDKNLSNKIKRNSIDIEALVKWAVNDNVDLDWLLTGLIRPNLRRGSGPTKDQYSVDSDEVGFRYMELFRFVQDKKRASNIIEELLEIEKLDPEAFIRIEGYLKGILDSLQMVSQRK